MTSSSTAGPKSGSRKRPAGGSYSVPNSAPKRWLTTSSTSGRERGVSVNGERARHSRRGAGGRLRRAPRGGSGRSTGTRRRRRRPPRPATRSTSSRWSRLACPGTRPRESSGSAGGRRRRQLVRGGGAPGAEDPRSRGRDSRAFASPGVRRVEGAEQLLGGGGPGRERRSRGGPPARLRPAPRQRTRKRSRSSPPTRRSEGRGAFGRRNRVRAARARPPRVRGREALPWAARSVISGRPRELRHPLGERRPAARRGDSSDEPEAGPVV